MKSSFVRALLLGISALGLSSAGHATTAVGHTPTSFDVTSSGSARYELPLTLPPGIAELQPRLALVYDSGVGNSLLGVGWSLSGHSTITRCPSTIAQNGETRGVELTQSDRFCLDGLQLRLTSGTYGQQGSQYRTELERFSRITASVSNPVFGPDSFLVEGKDGLYYHFGTTNDSRIEGIGSARVRLWALSRIEDRSGNAIVFAYTEDAVAGSYRPLSIDYGPAYGVRFFYETRPDPVLSYQAGFQVKQDRRLQRIELQHASVVVRKYTLAYQTAPVTKSSRITSITECAYDETAVESCFAPTTVVWQNGTAGWAGEASKTTAGTYAYAHALDINGDGREDLAWPQTGASGKWRYMLANETGGFGAIVTTTLPNTNYTRALPIDYNGDGLRDILYPDQYALWWVLQSTGSGFNAISTGQTAYGSEGSAWVGDFDGDGLEDVLWANGVNQIWMKLNSPTGFQPDPPLEPWTTESVFERFGNHPFGDLNNMFRGRSRVGDFNGDGRADLLVYLEYDTCEGEPPGGASLPGEPGPEPGEPAPSQPVPPEEPPPPGAPLVCPNWIDYWGVLLSRDLGSGPEFYKAGEIDTTPKPLLLDMNGDGRTDLAYAGVQTIRVRLSRGDGTFTPEHDTGLSFSGFSESLATDWDGDGRADLLLPGSPNWMVARSTGDSFEALVDSGIPATGASSFPKVLDYNGDGLSDLAYSNASGKWGYRLHAGSQPDLLQTATDGFGNAVTFTYRPITDNAVYANTVDESGPVRRDYEGALHVVDSYAANDGIGGSYTVDYEYRDADIDVQGRGFLGFGEIEREDSRSGIVTLTTYEQAFPYLGRIASQTDTAPDGKTLRAVTNQWNTLTWGTAQVDQALFPFPDLATEELYEYDTVPVTNAVLVTRTQDIQYHSITNTYGEPWKIIVTETGPGGTFETKRESPIALFVNDTANWCVEPPRVFRRLFCVSHAALA